MWQVYIHKELMVTNRAANGWLYQDVVQAGSVISGNSDICTRICSPNPGEPAEMYAEAVPQPAQLKDLEQPAREISPHGKYPQREVARNSTTCTEPTRAWHAREKCANGWLCTGNGWLCAANGWLCLF